MVTEIWVNIGSGNGLVPDGTKPLSEPMLTHHQRDPVTIRVISNFTRYLSHQIYKIGLKMRSKISFEFQGTMR